MSVIKNKTFKQLLWVGMGSIAMFFAGLTSAYIVRKAEGNWTEFILPEWFLYSTITIVISSLVLIIARRGIKQQKTFYLNPFRNWDIRNLEFFIPSPFKWMVAVFISGLIFSYFQFKGWQDLIEQGVFLTGEGSNVSGSFLYVITLAHLVHLIGGLIALLITAINTKRGKYTNKDCLGFELTTIYWHFLALLWVYLFFFLKYF